MVIEDEVAREIDESMLYRVEVEDGWNYGWEIGLVSETLSRLVHDQGVWAAHLNERSLPEEGRIARNVIPEEQRQISAEETHGSPDLLT